MVSTRGRARARALGALVLVLGVLLGAAQPGMAAGSGASWPAARAGDPRGDKIEDWLHSAVGRLSYQERKRLGVERDANRNLAMGFVDITGLSGLKLEPHQAVLVPDELKKSNPALYDELGLKDRPHIKKFVVATAANRQSSTTTGAHSEIVVLTSELTYMGVTDESKVFVMYSDRSPCEDRPNYCAFTIPRSTDVLYAVKYNSRAKAALEKLLTSAAAAESDAKRSPEDVKRSQEKAEAARKKAAEKKAREKERSMNLFQSPKKTQKEKEKAASQGPEICKNQALAAGPVAVAGTLPARRTALLAAPCGEQEDDGARPGGLAQALTEDPGGIDFSSLQLRYLSDPGDGSGLQYSFRAPDTTGGDQNPRTGESAAVQTSDAFFVWLALNPSAFWVNLNPNEPHRIVDAKLGRTDAGRIMLEADLQMKKSVGKLLHPDTELGRKFWDSISGSCMSQRVWILPAPATVRQDGDKLYIIDAPLDVRMETQYLAQKGRAAAVSCAQQDKAAEKHNEELFRSLILPKLKEAINTGPEYADVRRVYLARVAAEWYRDLSRTKHTTYGDLIGKGDIDNWRTKTDWKPTDTFEKFVDSYTKGEFKVTHNTTSGDTTYVHTYTYGGVDLTRIPFTKVSDDRFRKEHASLSKDIDKSLTSPAAGAGDRAVWLGAPTPLQASGGVPDEGPSARQMALRLLPALLVPIAALLWWRRRRLSTSATASPLRRAAAPHRQNQQKHQDQQNQQNK
ncbi:hypothetical protein [Streptomyces sp. NPDC049585]|uniref:hypothetical protein n=1 Tax=Streptomyces sp. NPDC049585 TaxID=3155154 RepID=UPI003413EAEE